ncbi:precorrin-6A synthase (deacetylating) [Roseicitreum antarcticum]|uniref:Precorrin-6A synthase [deacetylating] n=1 Tax=Roseicitreum antarcticum TaxID=564137 RepID=A0A1H2UBF4_9RHOB|nr:precorrin-6A synthase (deacetylating) [Roseicitreum antarcticum]SDW53455.1 precorrin-6A synthase (deacetylating) [Roseicitreum antarcticum]
MRVIEDLWLIGIGTGSLSHITLEGVAALRAAQVILVPHKGAGKDDLADLRYQIIAASGTAAQIIPFDYPTRDPALPYDARVSDWHDEIARRWQSAMVRAEADGPVALLVWGDPSLYDSTLRIARRLDPVPRLRAVPGITAIQALTAAHAIALNTVNGPVHITTGRRLRAQGWPEGVETVVVLLDGEAGFQHLTEPRLDIWWGAYLGSPDQLLHHGTLSDVTQTIVDLRANARARHGWIMDTYLMRKRP